MQVRLGKGRFDERGGPLCESAQGWDDAVRDAAIGVARFRVPSHVQLRIVVEQVLPADPEHAVVKVVLRREVKVEILLRLLGPALRVVLGPLAYDARTHERTHA
jgi:hypothetical protein